MSASELREPLGTTASLCPVCLRVVAAEVFIAAGRVRLGKRCPEHGAFEVDHLWHAPEIYRRLSALLPRAALPPHGLVLNVTNACNLSCPYCYSRANDMRLPELGLDEVDALAAGFGGRIVYLSGGEPTLHGRLPEATALLKARGFVVGLFSNGIRLTDEAFVARLRAAGLDFVILQLDTLRDERHERLRGRPLLEAKRRALEVLRAQALPAYLFVMLVEGLNDDEAGELLAFATANHDVVKILNFNPVWQMGRTAPGARGLTPTAIAELVAKQLGLGVDDLLESTELAFHAARLLSAIQGTGAGQPCCELRCYGIVAGSRRAPRFVPLNRLVDLPRANEVLRQVLSPPASRAQLALRLGRQLPRLARLGVASLLGGGERAARGRLLAGGLRSVLGASALEGSPLLSVIIGTFHTAETVDLAFQRTCNLYSHLPVRTGTGVGAGSEQRLLPACTRQIVLEQSLGARGVELDVDATVAAIQRELGAAPRAT